MESLMMLKMKLKDDARYYWMLLNEDACRMMMLKNIYTEEMMMRDKV